MMLAQVPEKLRPRSVFLLPDSRAVAVATAAFGFHYVYDKSVDQFAHPEVVYAVARDGRILHLLSPLTLTAGDLKTALSELASPPRTLYASLGVLCYRFGLLTGIYDAPAELALRTAGVLTIILMMAGLLLMLRRKRPRWT